MARGDKNTYDSYAKDDFDNPPAGPVGAHRGQRSFASRWLPFIIVIVAAIAAALVFWSMYSGAFEMHKPGVVSSETTSQATTEPKHEETQSASPSTTESASPSASPSETQSESPSPSPSESTDAVNYNTGVRVINGTGVTGYAANSASKLNNAGFTNVAAANPNAGSMPAQSVVWYQTEADLATAKQVASTLGISNVQQVNDIAAPVVAVLMQ
ncbi:cell wall integrity and stress response protein 1 [Bifidobacterium dolichotidis]|uniref:Cell wall integrity and stress response protein 1 n=1 Tax=Bifidobacterium dolichotidis TaxID=2306976 RepID=A0A430FPH0_9BIFI|nr:LytR C-terminal domain-containing protein [Bifidobacterium dolichotidis]RSX54732.1 cell wall integrity and stress response protein 1 [Bifidobacterium dolichotidis]